MNLLDNLFNENELINILIKYYEDSCIYTINDNELEEINIKTKRTRNIRVVKKIYNTQMKFIKNGIVMKSDKTTYTDIITKKVNWLKHIRGDVLFTYNDELAILDFDNKIIIYDSNFTKRTELNFIKRVNNAIGHKNTIITQAETHFYIHDLQTGAEINKIEITNDFVRYFKLVAVINDEIILAFSHLIIIGFDLTTKMLRGIRNTILQGSFPDNLSDASYIIGYNIHYVQIYRVDGLKIASNSTYNCNVDITFKYNNDIEILTCSMLSLIKYVDKKEIVLHKFDKRQQCILVN